MEAVADGPSIELSPPLNVFDDAFAPKIVVVGVGGAGGNAGRPYEAAP